MLDAFAPVGTGGYVRLSGRALALAVAGLLAACMSSGPPRLDEWGGGQNIHFAHVTKAEFETALHRVFDASGPKIYGLRPEEGGALVEQHWTLDVVFASASGNERWRLEYAPAGDGVDVHAEVEHALKAGFLPVRKEMEPSENTPNFRLLWLRVQYVLGGPGDWPQCESSSGLPHSGLCSANSSAAPPLRLVGSR